MAVLCNFAAAACSQLPRTAALSMQVTLPASAAYDSLQYTIVIPVCCCTMGALSVLETTGTAS
jgi:hypothetical protein